MKVMIMPNFDKMNAAECTLRVCRELGELGIQILFDSANRKFIDLPSALYGDFYEQLAQSDLLISIGGDGTIIHSAKHAVVYDKPVLGINAGRLGFLAGLEQDELGYLNRLVTGEYILEPRMMLEVVHRTSGEENHYCALNDVVVSKGALSRVIDLDVFCMDRFVSSYRADGIILSTPTGSTAYALSAGGPIVEPSMDSIGLTPLSPHSLFGRTILFGGENELKIKVNSDEENEAYLTVDGEQGIRVHPSDSLTISKSKTRVQMVSLYDKPFYEVLNEKFLMRAKE